MSRITAAKKSAIVLLGMLLVLLAVSFLPFGSDGSSRGGNEKSALLLRQIAAVDNLPPAVDVKIEPAVKDAIKEALYLAAAAKSPKEAAEKRKVDVLVKASSEDAEKEIKKAGGEVLNAVDSVDKTAKYFAVEVDADKVAAIAAGNDVSGISQRGVVYPTLDSSVPVIKADSFWNAGYKGSGVKVAVLDTGIDKNHPMLKGKVAAERDFTSSGTVADDCGHGTHVAGIVAGSKANGGSYDGVAPDVQLLNAKVLNLDSNGKCGGYVDYIIAAIGWALDPDGNSATDDGARVISMSLGGKGETSTELENNLKAAVAKGAVVVVSSGNCGSGCPDVLSCGSFRGVTWPGNSPSVITVGAVDDSKNVACFSSGENVQNIGIKPDFAAPGVDVTSSVPGSGYESKKGTSMAAPHVSGAVALMLGKSPGINQGDVMRILEKTALDLGDIGKDTSYGFGLIDMAKALAYKEGLEVKVELEQQVVSGSAQKITVRVYDDVTVNSVKATITKPNNVKTTDITFTSSGGNVYTYDFTDTALMGNYVVDAAVNYGGTSGSSGTGSESGGEPGSDSSDISSITVTQTAYFKVTSLTGDFGNVEEISISQQQKLSSNLTGTLKFANTAAVELNFSALLQLLDNGTLAQEIRLQPVTIAANSGATAAVNNALEIGPGNYTLRILTDYGAGSLVNETNITVTDDLAPQILKVDYSKTIKVKDAQSILVEVVEHQDVSANLQMSQVTGTSKCDGTNSVIISDDFNDNNLNYSIWETNEWSSGKRLEADGNLYFETGSSSDQQIRTLANIGAYDNFTLTLRMKIDYVSPDKNQGFWLGNLAEGQPSDTSGHRGYYWQFHGKTQGFNIGARYDDKSAGLHGKDSLPNWEPGKWHDIKVERTDGVARFYFDGALVGTDSTFAPLLNELYWNNGRTWKDPREGEGAKIHVDDFSVVTSDTGCESQGSGASIKPITANYTTRLVSEVGNRKTIAITIFNGSNIIGEEELDEGEGYVVTLQLCDESGNCYGKLGSGKKDAEFSIIGCGGKSVLVVKTYDVASVFEEAAAAAGNVCLSVINKSISGTPPASYLERFDALIWTTGTDLVNVDVKDAAALTDYYGKKGRIAVEGSDVAFRHGSDEFIRNVLHSELKTDLGFTVTSVANMSNLTINVTRQHPILYGLTSPLQFNATIDPFPDAVRPYNGSVELAEWSGLDTGGSAIVAYESETGDKKSLLLPFSIAALNGSDAKAIAASTLKWLLEDSAVDIVPLEIRQGSPYPLITRKKGDFCPMVCLQKWELKEGTCKLNECGSGCSADNVTDFTNKEDCELARQYYEGGAGSGVIVEGNEFTASAIVGSTETLVSPLRAKVLVDGDVLSEGIAVPVFNAPPPADKTPPRFINVTYSNHVWPFWKPAFIAKIFEENDLSVVNISVFTTSCPKGKYCILAEGQLYDVPVESKWKLLSKDGANQKVAAWLTTPLEAGSYYAQLRACDASGNCGKSKLVPFKVWWFMTGDNGEPSQIIFFKEPEPGDYAFSCEPEALEAEDYLNCLTVNKAATTAVINDLDSGEGSSSGGSGGGGGSGSNGRYQYNYSYNFSTSLGAGQHIVTVFANSDFSIKENNYANNIKDFSLMVYPKLPDLTLTGFAYNYNRELKNVKTALTASNLGGTAAKATVEVELKPESRIIFDDKTPRCGGIAGLKCAEKLQCIYSDGSTGPTYPDELGWCASETDSKWFAPKKQKVDVELAPGEAKYLTFTFELPQCMIEPWLCGWKLPSAYNFAAMIDPEGNVEEHNESNNKLSARIYLCSKEKVLVVDDNDAAFFSTPEPSSSDEFLDILRNSGYCVEVWDVKQQGSPGSSDLSGFKAVVWTAGDYFNGTVSNEDAMVIGNYGGGLLLEGSDVGLDDSEIGILQSIASAAFSSDMLLNDSQNETLVLKQHAITANITNISISKEKSPYPDGIEAEAANTVAEWQSGNGTAAITASNTSSRKTAYYAFSVDGITDPAAMERLVLNTVQWLLVKPNSPPLIQNLSDDAVAGEISDAAIKITMNEGQTRNFSVLAEDPDGDPLTYKWLLNGTLVSDKYYFAFSPKYNESGSYNLTVIVSDGQAEARAELLVTVLDTLDCGAGQKRLCALQLGVCNNSSEICGTAGKWPSCTAAAYLSYSSEYEVNENSCDGLDNDCDGLVDEGFGDVDDDEIADCIDKDNDNDDVEDDKDDLIGNESSINFTGDAGDDKKLKIEIKDSEDEKEKAHKVKWVKLNHSDKPLLQFSFNFSKGNILLRNLTIEKQKNDSKEGFTLVRGLDLKGGTKQVYVDRLVSGSNAVCVKDKEVSRITEVSSGCDSEAESLLTCEAAGAEPAGSGLACRLTSGNGQFQIYGLKHSAVMEACTDADLDSYLPTGCSGGTDCNDNNASISPAAAEVCNGVDDNCNGQVDENRVCNTAPVLQSIGNKTVSENGTLSFAVAATDSEGDSLTFNATKLPQDATFSNATAAFAWTPNFAQSGVYSVTFNVSDGLLHDYETINVTVANVNRAPVFETAGNKTVPENAELGFTVSVTDPDGDPLAQLFVNVPERLANAQFSSSTKEFKWTPTFDDSGSYAIWFTASDGQLSTNESVNVTVVNVNRLPRFENLTNRTALENSSLRFFANASDPDNDLLTVTLAEIPAKFSSSATFDGKEFALPLGFEDAGSYSATFSASDGQATADAIVNFTVANVNRAPSISGVNGNLTVNETEKVTAAVSASDADEDALTYSLNDSRFSQPSAGIFKWSTDFSSAGAYVVLATASDGSATAQFAFTATVKNVNRAPRFENITNQIVLENSTLRFFANATDPDADSLQFTVEVPPKLAAAEFSSGKMELSWQPTFDDSGNYAVIFAASDGQHSAFAEANITVLNVNVAPSITNVHGSLIANETENVTLIINASDHDGDALAYGLNDSRFVQDSQSINTFRWKTGYEEAGTYVVLASASDGLLTTAAAVTVKVDNANRAPVLAAMGNKTVNENSTLRFTAAASDPDSDPVSIAVAKPQAAEGLSFDSSASEVVWTPTFEQAGSYALAITASDGNLTDSEQVNISVLNVNRAPAIMLLLVDPPELVMGEGEMKTFAADVADADNDAVTVAWKVNGETVSTQPQLEFTPKYYESGEYAIELLVSDYSETSTTTMTLTVQDTLDCETEQTKLCPLQLGVCANSLETCAAPGNWLGCAAAAYYSFNRSYVAEEASPASCDGLDNDCDGSVDERPTCTLRDNWIDINGKWRIDDEGFSPVWSKPYSEHALIAEKNETFSDVEVKVEMSTDSSTPRVGVCARLSQDGKGYCLSPGWGSTRQITLSRFKGYPFEPVQMKAGPHVPVSNGGKLYLKLQAAGNILKGKVWPVGGPEPGWQVEATTDIMGMGEQLSSGFVGYYAYIGYYPLIDNVTFGHYSASLPGEANSGPGEPCSDSDGDGQQDAHCGGTDCDDSNESVYWNAAEACNGADDDCDSRVDEGCLIGSGWSVVNGDWAYYGEGRLMPVSYGYGGHPIVVKSGENFTNAIITATGVNYGGRNELGVCGRLSPDGKGYCLSHGGGGIGYVVLRYFDGYPYNPQAVEIGPNIGVELGQPYSFKLLVNGSDLKGKVWLAAGQEPVEWQVQDRSSRFSSGSAGYYSYYTNITFEGLDVNIIS